MEALERRRDAMIAALWSNSNYDDDKGTRQEAIADIEEKCDEAITIILLGYDPMAEPEGEIEDKYGFFAAGERGTAKIMQPRDDEGTVGEVIDYTKYTDQH